MSYDFTVNFHSDDRTMKNLSNIFNTYGCPNTIIEVGVYEGYTTFWLSDVLAKHNSNLKIYAVDPHTGSNDLAHIDFEQIKERFCYNLSVNQNNNVIYVSKPSNTGLIELITQNVKAQLIYIDGDHRAAEVLTDVVLAWQLLDIGGIIICDDSTTWRHRDSNGVSSPHMSPRMAIESFIHCYWDKLDIVNLPYGTQTAFVKVRD